MSFGTIVAILVFVHSAAADVFVLSNGGRIEGRLLNPDQSPRQSYVVETAAGGRITLAERLVERLVIKSPEEKRYDELLPRMPDTVDGHWKMAEWCRENRLHEQRELHLQEIVKRDADHEGARHGLGYSRVGDRWVRMDEFMRSQGYVRNGSAWRLPQEAILETHRRDREQAENEWRRNLKIWRGWLNRKRANEAVANIRDIRDPQAAPALVDMLDDEENPQMKRLYVEVLGQLESPASVAALAKLALEDNNELVRDKCLDGLEKFAARPAARIFIKALSSDNNVTVNRAGVGLARMKAADAVAPLIDAVTTKHKFLVQPPTGGGGPGAIGVGFSGGGPGGLTVGGKPKLVEQEFPNAAVLEALIVLTDGVNYRYDKAAWKRWYAEENTPQNINLRRRDD